jgi:tetratricopeptide (TPR) repeat protein
MLAAIPKSPDAQRFYAEGLRQVRAAEFRKADASLGSATHAEPGFALAHAARAFALKELGYESEARDEAAKAFQLSRNLSSEDQRAVEGLYREMTQQWDLASDIYAALVGFHPDNIEYGLKLARAEINNGKATLAGSTLDNLRKMPAPLGNDPRIDLLAADAALSTGEYQRTETIAERALKRASELNLPSHMARAQYLLASAFEAEHKLAEAKNAAMSAQELYARAQMPFGTASTYELLANIAADEGQASQALAWYEQEQKLCEQLDYKKGLASALNNIGLILAAQGDGPRALQNHQKALALFRQIGDKRNQGQALTNIAAVHQNNGDLKQALANYQQALLLAREIDNKDDEAAALNNVAVMQDGLGRFADAEAALNEALTVNPSQALVIGLSLADVALHRGDLSRAEAAYSSGLAKAREVNDKRMAAYATAGLGTVARLRGDTTRARSLMTEALETRNAIGEKAAAADSQLALAELSRDEGQPQFEQICREAIQQLQSVGNVDSFVEANAVLAMYLAANGRRQEAQTALAAAQKTATKTQALRTRLLAQIATGRVTLEAGELAGARRSLTQALRAADSAGTQDLSFEASLALVDLDRKAGNLAAARKRSVELQAKAQNAGYGHITTLISALGE